MVGGQQSLYLWLVIEAQDFQANVWLCTVAQIFEWSQMHMKVTCGQTQVAVALSLL